MNSLLELIREEKFEEKPASLRKLLQSHKAHELSLGALFASHEMLTEYIKSPRWIIALGPIDENNGVMKDSSGSYRIPAKLGFLLKPAHNPPEALGEFIAAVDLAAVQCFGTEDPGGEDEVYGFISLFSLVPGEEEKVIVKKVGVKENVKKGNVIFQNTPIGQVPLTSGANGLKIHMTLWDEEEAGPPDQAAEKVRKGIQLSLVAGAAGLGAVTAKFPNPYTAAVAAGMGAAALLLEEEHVATLMKPIHALIAELFQDDLIGEKMFTVSANQIDAWSTDEGYNSSLKRRPELGADVSFNTPVDVDNPAFLFNEGGSTYKVFFNVRAKKVDPFPINKG